MLEVYKKAPKQGLRKLKAAQVGRQHFLQKGNSSSSSYEYKNNNKKKMSGKADLPSGKHNKGHLPHCFAPSCHAAGVRAAFLCIFLKHFYFESNSLKAHKGQTKERGAKCKPTNVYMQN